MFIATVLTLLVLSVAPSLGLRVVPASPVQDSLREWLCADKTTCVKDFNSVSVPELRTKVLKRLNEQMVELLQNPETLLKAPAPTQEPTTVKELFSTLLHSDAALADALHSFARKKGSLLESFKKKFHSVFDKITGKHTAHKALLQQLRDHLVKYARKHSLSNNLAEKKTTAFEILPQYRGSAMYLNKNEKLTVKSNCFSSGVTFAATLQGTDLHVTADMSNPTSTSCSEQFYINAGPTVLTFKIFSATTTHQEFTLNATSLVKGDDAMQWYAGKYGLMVYQVMTSNVIESVVSVIDTVTLLAGFGESPISASSMSTNIAFINQYIQADRSRMGYSGPRTAGNTASRLNPDVIKTGDLLMLLRPDGIDPMIGWGEGSLAGHSVVAIRDPENNALMVCESTTQDAYWPTNGIQCHDWLTWVALCQKAEQNVVWVPLNDTVRAKFSTAKAMEFFKKHNATDYGYSSFLFGWIDVLKDNFPCTPGSNYTTCLDTMFALQLANIIDGAFGSNHQNFFRQALAHRAGNWQGKATVDIIHTLYYAEKKDGKSFSDLYQMLERDDYLYYTMQDGKEVDNGKSMVCCVFVCNMWKAGGIFDELGSDFQCGEQTLWDLYSMKIYNEQLFNSGRPQVCQQDDPQNFLCQLMGNLTMVLAPDVNTRPLYKHMGDHCAAAPPAYIRPEGC